MLVREIQPQIICNWMLRPLYGIIVLPVNVSGLPQRGARKMSGQRNYTATRCS